MFCIAMPLFPSAIAKFGTLLSATSYRAIASKLRPNELRLFARFVQMTACATG
jgi:hypothetical protein